MHRCLIFAILVLFFCKKVEMSQREVFAHLFDNYEKRMKPLRNESQVIHVQIQINIISLLEVNEPQEYIRLALTFDHNWHDDFLVWDPKKFNGTTKIVVPASMVWQPDVTVVSTVLETEHIIEKEDQMLFIEYTGDIFFNFPIVLTNHCPMVTDEFPFDSQDCVIVLSSWMYAIDELELEHTGMETSIQNNNTEWDVFPYVNESTIFYKSGQAIRNLNYHQKIRRKPTYYIWVIIVPTFIITALCFFGIFAPFSNTGDREEKITVGLTTLLTLAVILSLVTGEMPRATNLPLLGRFILFEISVCVICMALSVFIMFLHQRATTRRWEIPQWLKKSLFCNNSVQVYKADELVKENKEKEPTESEKTHSDFQKLSDAIFRVNRILEQYEMVEEIKLQWTVIFDRIDLALLLGFQFLHVIYFIFVFRTSA